MPHGWAGAVGPSAAPGFEVAFVDADGAERHEPLTGCLRAEFERARPVRGFASFPGSRISRGFGGYPRQASTWASSWLERDVVMWLDADPDVAAVASQPFWLSWPDGERLVRHAPDFFARRADGTGLVIDVRADDRIEPGDAAKFKATARVCALAGWDYLRTGALDPVLAANLRWLSGYRHPRYAAAPLARDLARIFERPRALMDGARAAGDPIAVLPALFGLLWRQTLVADLASEPLDSRSVVWSAGAGR